jgi:hypothetical protein
MYDSVHSGHGGSYLTSITDIAADEFKRRVSPCPQQGFAAVQEAIHHADSVPLGQQQRGQSRSNITCTTSNQYVHRVIISSTFVKK